MNKIATHNIIWENFWAAEEYTAYILYYILIGRTIEERVILPIEKRRAVGAILRRGTFQKYGFGGFCGVQVNARQEKF